ncbi:hypothetical protein SAMN05444166_6314 [Singulisphaera sp. GP187]|uniref:hypothetical protein n=1 Tax=Singulisphaera sp. GP187 TaxID=1882752 RepID=UPI00092A6553|nr:hypothetical protein [Singulisphaera sp. GP187]SIO60227.1 hypothetical protein SAMN05444166_6314 [Singulisphaera sp. GP187]
MSASARKGPSCPRGVRASLHSERRFYLDLWSKFKQVRVATPATLPVDVQPVRTCAADATEGGVA